MAQAMTPEGTARRFGWPDVLLVAFGATCVAGTFASGFYETSQWGIFELAALVVLLATAVAAPHAPARRALLALGGLAGLTVWAWLSRGWGESAAAALNEANRFVLYVAILGSLCLLVRGREHATVLLAAVTAAAAIVALYVVARLATGHGPGLFLYGRLNEPLGYVNGQAGLFLFGLWPALALAERREPLPAAAGAALAALLGCLLILTQSRGVALAAAVTTLLVVVVVPGRQRRVWALIAVGIGVAVAVPSLLDVYDQIQGRAELPAIDVTRHAGVAALFAAAIAGALWAAATAAARGFNARGAEAQSQLRGLSTAVLGGILLVALVVGLAGAGRVSDRVHKQYDSFVHLGAGNSGESRFLSGGGNRYDYWRIALREFDDEPFHGVGAGNYDVDYFLQRRTAEDVRQPHSLVLQTLAELGLVGGLLLVLLLVPVLAGVWTLARRGRQDAWARAMAVGAGGGFLVWLVQTDVDWLHLLPAITGPALAAATIALRPWERGEESDWPAPVRAVVLGVLAVAVVVAAVAIARPLRAEHLRGEARHEMARDPVAALRQANQAIAIDGDTISGYYLRASAYARLDDYTRARGALQEALRLEPHDSVTWALLGDLARRRGDAAVAARAYRRASELNPKDEELARQARQASR